MFLLLNSLPFDFSKSALPTSNSNRNAIRGKIAPSLGDPVIQKYLVKREPRLSEEKLWKLARGKIKHVFVIYQENRSFDHYFGTFPGAEGIFSHPRAQTPGFYQPIQELDGKTSYVQPFRIGPKEYAADTDDVDHSHGGIVKKMNVSVAVPQMDRFALTEEQRHERSGTVSLQAKQFGELTMAYVDGDTIPFLWRYANRFVLCDHIFQTMTGPSTPGNLAIIGAQAGATQQMLHPEMTVGKGSYDPGVPVLNDANPFFGSAKDPNKSNRMPYNPEDNPKYTPQINLTFATILLSLAGKNASQITNSDRDKKGDLDDVADDVKFLTDQGRKSIPWGWFEEGFDKEPTDAVKSDDPLDAQGSHASYVTHHNGPQYFGYLANNPAMNKNLHGLHDLHNSIIHQTLPSEGVFYLKGGFQNQMGLHPSCPDPRVQKNFVGDDDHPGYSDAQISEAMVAKTVNEIARSKYWKDSVIIITWDDSEGDYDHVPPPVRTIGPDGNVESDGPRVPMIVISPFSRTHMVMHNRGSQSSVVKFIDRLFNRTSLASLPDEAKGIRIGNSKGLKNQGPEDGDSSGMSDLLNVLDPSRLLGNSAPLPGAYAVIPDWIVNVLPIHSGYGLKNIGVLPTDQGDGLRSAPPNDFNPRPGTMKTKS